MKTQLSDSYWQKFFGLTSSAFTYMENLPMLPQHRNWSISKLRDKIQNMMDQYPIKDSLRTYAATNHVVNTSKRKKDSYYAVISFNSLSNTTTISYYPKDKYHEAVREYEELENNTHNNVLVAINDLKKLHDAYPNYFKDISRFREMIESMLDFKHKMS